MLRNRNIFPRLPVLQGRIGPDLAGVGVRGTPDTGTLFRFSRNWPLHFRCQCGGGPVETSPGQGKGFIPARGGNGWSFHCPCSGSSPHVGERVWPGLASHRCRPGLWQRRSPQMSASAGGRRTKAETVPAPWHAGSTPSFTMMRREPTATSAYVPLFSRK